MGRPPLALGGRGTAKLDALVDFARSAANTPLGCDVAPPPSVVGANFKASRAEFLRTPAHFDLASHLPLLDAACFLEPRLLEAERSPCPLPVAGIRSQRRELLQFARQLDRAGKLHLALPSEVPLEDRMNLLAVYKSAELDRVVWDRRRRNWRELHLRGAAAELPAGYDFAEFELGPDEAAYLFSDDLADFYPSVDASEARAVTNALAVELKPEELGLDLRAMRRFDAQALPSRVVPCARTLVMGDLNAVDWATGGHRSVLEDAGALDPSVQIVGGRPFPRGGRAHALVIDDHVALVRGPMGAAPVGGRSGRAPPLQTVSPDAAATADAFRRAGAAYRRVGLRRHPEKKRRGDTNGVILGAEVRGQDGLVAAERLRRLRLSALSLQVAASGRASGGVLRKLTSNWTYVLLFRRPLMCLLGALFAEMPDIQDDRRVYSLSAAVRSELAWLAALAPAMVADMRAAHSQDLICTDASEMRLGAVSARIGAEVHRELWRLRERRGWPTHLMAKPAEWLRARGPPEEAAAVQELVADYLPLPDPNRALVERFDMLEICCGPDAPLLTACGAAGLRVGPRIDLQLHPVWDLRSTRVVEWILHLVAKRRVLYVHSGVPCTTFSIARRPALRSAAHPLGFNPAEVHTATGNVLMSRALVVLWAIRRAAWGAGSHEHPRSAYSWRLPAMLSLLAAPEVDTLTFSMCQFGAPYRKDTRLVLVRAGFLAPLARRCGGGHDHLRLCGSRTSAAAAYPPGLCTQWASLVAAHAAQQHESWESMLSADAGCDAEVERGAWESTVMNEVVRSAPWALAMVQPVRSREHINLLEARAQVRMQARQAQRSPEQRQLYGMDSRVALGALAKGRSPSWRLNSELRLAIPAVVAFAHYPGYAFTPTRLNPADCPTRDMPLPEPREVPDWLGAARTGDPRELDRLARLPLQSRRTAEWCRFVVLLLRPVHRAPWAGDIFDSTKGYPGEGPRLQQMPLNSRPSVDLQAERALLPVTLRRRTRLLLLFRFWLHDFFGISELGQFLREDGRVIARYLASYGQLCYDRGVALGDFVETVNAVVDQERGLRRHLDQAWDVVRAWQLLLPSGNRRPTPLPLMLAMVSLALHWHWVDMAALVLVSFAAMLRPAEALALTRADILLPQDLLDSGYTVYVRINRPKMRRLTARREHVRVDDPWVAFLLTAWLRHLLPGQRLLDAGSPTRTALEYRRMHDDLVSFFGIPPTDRAGITPASHRGGGATWFFQATGNLELTRWRGRWQQNRTLEVYLQEVAAASLLPELSPDSRRRVQVWADLAPMFLRSTVAALNAVRPVQPESALTDVSAGSLDACGPPRA